MSERKSPIKARAARSGAERGETGARETRPSRGAGSRGQRFPIVGIGASAGGLEAIEKLLGAMPSEAPFAIVIIQHLSPEHKSIMRSLLEKYTKMRLIDIRHGMRLEPGCIYLNPPNKDILLKGGAFQLTAPSEARAVRLPIDIFFRSLAESAGERAICIVLSGTGSDGTLGLQAVKAAGGLVMAQEESQARYGSMPRSAADTGLADFVLPVEKMPGELLKYIAHRGIKGLSPALPPSAVAESRLQKIFALIRSGTGHDFSHYKRNTILRRIERRMAVQQVTGMGEYLSYLQETPAEVKKLFGDLLITVTNFFRDPKGFAVLAEKVVAPLVGRTSGDEAVRVWVPGCATGEEAYSLAILFCEAMEAVRKSPRVTIFATDIDARAVERARQGSYPESITADVSKERLRQFFVKEGEGYRVKRHIREMVVFAVQDLVKDPPFSRLDLVCCRNVLIYMDVVLQKRLLPLFRYTLRPGGCLMLGTSETIGGHSDCFGTLDAKWRIFRRRDPILDGVSGGRAPAAYEPPPGSWKPAKRTEGPSADIRRVAERLILESTSPPCVLVDEKLDILYFHGDTSEFLGLPRGGPRFNILEMAREDLRVRLERLLHRAFKEKRPAVEEGIALERQGRPIVLDIVVRPATGVKGSEGSAMVAFEVRSLSPGAGRKAPAGKAGGPHASALREELRSTKERLQTAIEELETSNEELRSANEELQSTNEEMQSTNEELETSREELQSINEELQTVNAELQDKVSQLSNANNDLNNLLSSTEIATLFLDNELHIKRFTQKARDLFRVIDSDVGRPIGDIAHALEYDGLVDDARRVVESLARVELDVRSKEGKWFIMRISPYRTVENSIDGVVLTFSDITILKAEASAAELARTRAESILEAAPGCLALLDARLRMVGANGSFRRAFALGPRGWENTRFIELGGGAWEAPGLEERLEAVLRGGPELQGFEVSADIPGAGRKTLALSARLVPGKDEGAQGLILSAEGMAGR